jgi:RimJ/RimL family protein N-acetyltransferase
LTSRQRVTDRLRLRPAEPGDVEFLARIHTAHSLGAADRRKIQALVRDSETWWHLHGYGVWIASWEDGGEPAAWCSLRPLPEPGTPELSYGVRVADRGRGLATEAASGVLANAFALPDVRRVWAATTPAHIASIRVMQKLGLVCQCRALLEGIDSVIYGIDRREFERCARSLPAR